MTLTYTTLDDPLAVNGTYVTGVNGNGQIVGYYVDGSGSDQGFIFSDGVYTTVVGTEYWTSVNTGNGSTLHTSTVSIVPESINNSGEIVGYIPAVNFSTQGLPFEAFTYQYGTTGVFSAFATAGLNDQPLNVTVAQGVNNQGQVVGYANLPGPGVSYDGFEFAGNFSSAYFSGSNAYVVEPPTTLSYPNSENTRPQGVNNQGEIVGNWTGTDPNFSGVMSHAFIYNNGAYLYFDDPNGANGTFAQGVNDSDVIVGYYLNQNDLAEGFEYNQITKTYTSISVPGATETYLYGINDAGEIVGSYVDSSGDSHGFEAGNLIAPSITTTSDSNATPGQQVALSRLVTISDPSGVGYQLQLWDSDGTTAGGEFLINGTPQIGGHAINVPSGANVVFDAGTAGGTDTLWAQLIPGNGTASGWKELTVTVPPPTLAVANIPSGTRGEVISLSSLVTISDPSNVGYQLLQLWDSDGTLGGGEFEIGNVAQPANIAINVAASAFANTVFDVGTLGGTDTLWARLEQNNGTFTAWEEFTVTAPKATLPSLAVTASTNAHGGQAISLSSLITISDPSNVGYQTLQLWDSDGTMAGGEFLINGTAQTGGHAINVPSGANVVFDAGTSGGTDTLWAELIQSNNAASGWAKFTVTVPLPSLAVGNIASATHGLAINLSSLVTINNPGNVSSYQLQLWDSDGTATSGEFLINGTAQSGGHAINVSSGANVVFEPGTLAGTDTLWAQLIQGSGASTGWDKFTITVPNPTVAVQNFAHATPGQTIALSNLVTISDPGNVGYQKLELWDSNGTAATGQFMVGGVGQTGGHEIDVSPANVASTVFDEGTNGTTDTLWAQLELNNGTVTGWEKFTVVDPVTIEQGATLELTGAYAGQAIFAGNAGTLQLDDSADFSGTVAGMSGSDTIDLRDVGFNPNPTLGDALGYTANATSTGGSLSIGDGSYSAQISLLGQYAANSFVAASDGHGGTSIELRNTPLPVLAQSQHA